MAWERSANCSLNGHHLSLAEIVRPRKHGTYRLRSEADGRWTVAIHMRVSQHPVKMGMNRSRSLLIGPSQPTLSVTTGPRTAWQPRDLFAVPQLYGADRTRGYRAGCATLL